MSATTRVAALIEERVRRNRQQPDDTFVGTAWWQVTEQEELVFMLSTDIVRRIGVVWGAYQQVLGVEDYFEELDEGLIAALRAEYSFLQNAMSGDVPELTWKGFVDFGAMFGCDHRSCLAWYWKNFFREDRRGLHDWQ